MMLEWSNLYEVSTIGAYTKWETLGIGLRVRDNLKQ
jgi:hypothetical protein